MDEMDKLVNRFNDFLTVLGKPIFQVSGNKISILSVISSLIVVYVSLKLANFFGKLVNRFLLNNHVDSGVRDSIEKFSRYLLTALGILFALDNLGISISSLAAVGAVLMVGIGFGLQNIAQNFISGIIILIERPVKVGDIIRVGNASGRIIDIRVRSTVVQTRDEVTIIVPNSKLISEEVINDSYSGQKIRLHVRVGVAYGSNVKQVKEILMKAALGHEKVVQNPPPVALFEDFGDSSLKFDLRFWCSDIWKMETISSDIRTEIDTLFREAKIEIPFPRFDVNIRDKFPEVRSDVVT